MPCLIADSGPLIALAKLGLLDLPTRLFGRVAMPATVFAGALAALLERVHYEGYFISPELTAHVLAEAGEA